MSVKSRKDWPTQAKNSKNKIVVTLEMEPSPFFMTSHDSICDRSVRFFRSEESTLRSFKEREFSACDVGIRLVSVRPAPPSMIVDETVEVFAAGKKVKVVLS